MALGTQPQTTPPRGAHLKKKIKNFKRIFIRLTLLDTSPTIFGASPTCFEEFFREPPLGGSGLGLRPLPSISTSSHHVNSYSTVGFIQKAHHGDEILLPIMS